MNIFLKITRFFIIILFLFLPFINSHFFDFIGISNINFFYVEGNYEFTKVTFFNILSGLVLFFYSLYIFFSKKSIFISKYIFFIFTLIFLSSIFSYNKIISFFGNTDKNHSFLMFSNLLGLFIYFLNEKKAFKKNILKYLVIGLFFIIFFAVKEYFFPTFNYGNLSNRALGTFGHPNYLALYLLIFLPIIYYYIVKNNKIYLKILLFLTIITLILTKSFLGILLLFAYVTYKYFFSKVRKFNKGILFIIIFFIFLGVIFYIIKDFGYSKLHSFLSRFYIWDTIISIINSNIKILFLGNGLGTLGLVFDNYKSPFLYIFENFGFTADRAHNIFLEILYNFGIFGLFIFIYFLKKLFSLKNIYIKESLFLAFLFLLLNFASLNSYLIIIFLISFIHNKTNNNKLNNYFLFFISLFSLYGVFNSINLYQSEIYFYNGNYKKAKDNYIFGENLYKNNFCNDIIDKNNKSAELYFYCGNLEFDYGDKQIAIKYYKLGLQKIPDLRNKNSIYFNNVFIKNNEDILHRFFSEKYNNLIEILNKVGEKGFYNKLE